MSRELRYLPTLVISILMFRMTSPICGSLMSEFESFMISVDFCRDPVTLVIAFCYA